MAYRWQLQEAKNRFSEVVDEALAHGPQIVTRHGQEVIVIVSYAEFKQMQKAQLPLSDFLRQSPLAGVEELNLDRDNSAPRSDFEL